MNTTNPLGILTDRLGPKGHQRLFEFLEITDTAAAARFREWLATATAAEVDSAAEILNRTSRGNEFLNWWGSRDTGASSSLEEKPHARVRQRTPLEQMHSQARARSANADLTIGGIWLGVGLLITIASYSWAVTRGGGSYVIATGAIIFGAFRLIRGLKEADEVDTHGNSSNRTNCALGST
jgi:hypothetical protein